MAILKCKMCGGGLEVLEGVTVCECEYCGTKQTVPTIDDEKKAKLFDRANKLRFNCEFDKAAGVYESIVADYPEEAEGYWGLVLCRYGIEYVDDPVSGEKIPTCHRSSFDSIMDDEDFELVMENSDSLSRAVYREEAKNIEEIRKGIIEVSGKEEPYDIFICYKETDENGERTLDSVLAQDVYDELTGKGYRVFFSRITLEDKLGVEYEPYIFAALNSAKIMLAFGTSYDYYNSVWVKNEWSRYLKLMAKDKSKHLIPCFKNVDAYDIPKEFAKLQSQDMGKIGALQDLMRGIDKLLAPEQRTESSKPIENIIYNNTGSNGETFIKRGFMAIEDNEWNKATEFFEQALNMNAEDGRAYWGELLVEYKCSDAKTLAIAMHETLIKEVSEEEIPAVIEDRYPKYKEEYFFIEAFDQAEIERLFHTPFLYKSSVSSIESIISANKENFVLAGNRLYQRAKQYADATVQEYLRILHDTVDDLLAKTKAEIKENEREAIGKAIAESEAYFALLKSALMEANRIAIRNTEKNKAAFQKDYDAWVQEKESFSERHAEWERKASQKRTELNSWELANRDAMRRWNEEKANYAVTRKKLEDELARLLDEKTLISSFRAAKKEKEIMDKRNELRRLTVPANPQISPAPVIPTEIVLRDEPKITFGELIAKEEVFNIFYSLLENQTDNKF